MRYEGSLYRPPSEAHSYILQATIGCSHNLCLYCDMYRAKTFRLRPLEECLEDLDIAAQTYGRHVEKIFVADGDALVMPMEHWLPILKRANDLFPRLRRVSCYAMASNILEKTDKELEQLQELGLKMLYIGPESGDEKTLKRLVKGGTYDEHVEAAKKAKAAGMKTSVIVLLGAGGVERSDEHAKATASLITEMDPDYVSALTLTVIPETPMERLQNKGKFELPQIEELLAELRTIVDETRPTNATFRTNHASNYLPLAGQLPQDRERIVSILDAALNGEIPLRPEWSRGL
ncbi:MAG TPA: radical SAM protein [Myxococcales bacterium]|nr:radical SAM protein [Deltaproteobacteria bacterium]HAA56886.1 radical SAM protein [Myxococcales bacterium]|tara:strand:+ start:2927 stop:3799 length:873 start_codon:yes stop_codon:yes gene_type:complete